MTYSGMTALVTGASSGLGEAFAEQLAAAGANLVLAARSEDRLHELADRLRARYAARVIVRPIDLASAQALTTFAAEIERGDVMIDLLVNNAGFGIFEDVLAASLERQLAQIDVNIRALVTLARACAPAMVAAGRGGIINVASTAGFQPMPGAAVYAASKAFVVSFSQAFAYELREKNVRVTVVCPGPVATAFFANMNPGCRPRRWINRRRSCARRCARSRRVRRPSSRERSRIASVRSASVSCRRRSCCASLRTSLER